MDIDAFALRVANLNTRSAGDLIPVFAYYCQEIQGKASFAAADINACFTALSLKPYSNISTFLSRKAQGKNNIFLKQKNGYSLMRQEKERLAQELAFPIDIPVSNAFIDLSIVQDTPYYIKGLTKQMAQCYECGLYDATLVLMRKLIETLIIETFERFGIDALIKDANGYFLFLSDLIPKYQHSSKWNTSRNLDKNIAKVKKYGDLSAHNRRYQAKQSDIDGLKFELRQVIQEMVLMIDYPNWDRSR